MIDTVHSYVSCVSYDELRRFLTSAAENEICHVQNGIYIPSSMDITTVDYSRVQEGDDNIDTNCQTIDGKNTLHAMARVLFQEQATDKPQLRR